MPEGLAGSPLLIIVKGVGGGQFRRDPQGQFKFREKTFQRGLIQQLVLQVRQLQQLLLSSPIQLLVELLLDFQELLPYLPALRLLAEPLVQGHHVIFIVYRLLLRLAKCLAALGCSHAWSLRAPSATHNTLSWGE